MLYLAQLEDTKSLKALLERYPLGLESYAFGSAAALDCLPQTFTDFARDLQPFAQNGLSLHGPFLDLCPAAFDPMVRAATLRRFEDSYRAAAALGASRIVYHTGFYPQVYWPEVWEENSVFFWREFLRGKDASVQIHLENHYDPDWRPLRRVVEAVGHPAFSACFDSGHANVWSPLPAEEWLSGLGARAGHFHWHNNDGRRDGHLAPDNGTLDLLPLMERALRDCPSASWSLELCDAGQAVRSLQWLERHLPLALSRGVSSRETAAVRLSNQ